MKMLRMMVYSHPFMLVPSLKLFLYRSALTMVS